MENIVQQPTTPPSTPCKNIKSIRCPKLKQIVKKVDKDPFAIGDGKYVKLSTYKHKPYVNIREYVTSTNGKLHPTKKGILLKPEEWKQLQTIVKQVNQRLKSM